MQASEYGIMELPVGHLQVCEHEVLELPGAARWLYASRCAMKEYMRLSATALKADTKWHDLCQDNVGAGFKECLGLVSKKYWDWTQGKAKGKTGMNWHELGLTGMNWDKLGLGTRRPARNTVPFTARICEESEIRI